MLEGREGEIREGRVKNYYESKPCGQLLAKLRPVLRKNLASVEKIQPRRYFHFFKGICA